jgi:acyl-CoA synthetase (AMP-forming)/AMP-acid ligase II
MSSASSCRTPSRSSSPFKLPERLELRDELPRNPLGKILKRELRAELRHS